jgi:hypothetical protein
MAKNSSKVNNLELFSKFQWHFYAGFFYAPLT